MSFRPVNASPSRAVVGHVNSPSATTTAASHFAPRDPVPRERLQSHKLMSSSDSQATALSSASTESTRVFTPATIEPTARDGLQSSGQASSQESQLLHLSQLAAAAEKMPDASVRSSAKRTADGTVKNPAASPTASPGRHCGHSRNVSGVSVASTSTSRVTELSTELKTRLSYAMLKVNNGWQSKTIDEVEGMASRAVSPASTSSTILGGNRSSGSPQLHPSHRPTPVATTQPPTLQSRQSDGVWQASPTSPAAPQSLPASLAPPVSIQPHRIEANPRRNSNPKYTPSFLSPRSHHASPHTPAVPSLSISPQNRNLRAAADPMVISPTHNNREKDAMEALLFMSSPGNSANLKTNFPSSSQPIISLRNGASAASTAQRTALPTSAPKRKSLPNGRPSHSSQPLPAAHSPKKRVVFGRSQSTHSEMDLDDPASPRRHGGGHMRPPASTARRSNGAGMDTSSQGRHSMPPAPPASSRPARPRPRLSYEHLDEVLDRVAAEASSSESEGEIELPARREGPGMRA